MDANDKKYVVYMHISPSQKRYIGITSQKPQKRWKSDGSGYKEQPLFWRAICKYGWDNFQHKILLQNETFEYACQIEKCLIKHYKTYDSRYGYNLTLGGEGRLLTDKQKKALSEQRQGPNACGYGYFPSDETKKKMSDAAKNKVFTQVTREKMSHAKKKTVYQYDLDGELIEVFSSATDAADKTKTNRGNLCACCRNVVKQANGYFWSYNFIDDPMIIKNYIDGKIDFSTIHTRNEKRIVQMDLDGNELRIFGSIKEASQVTSIPAQEISQACKIPNKVTREFKWKALENNVNDSFEIINQPSRPFISCKQIPLVLYRKDRDRWMAYRFQDGKRKIIKTCKMKEEAVEAYYNYLNENKENSKNGNSSDLFNPS